MAKIRRFVSLKSSLPAKEAEALWIQAAYSDESFGMRAGVQSLLVEKTLALHQHPEINGTDLLEKVRKWEVSSCPLLIYSYIITSIALKLKYEELHANTSQLFSFESRFQPLKCPVYIFKY
jgi:hypothetical protein